MAVIKDTTTDANGNIIVNVSSSADDAITLATAGTYSDKNIIFNLTTPAETDPTVPAWAKSKTKPTYTASEVGAVPTSRTVNGKALSANITLAASDVGALPSNTHIPSTVAEMSDAGNYALKSDKVSKSGDTMTGKLTVPQVETGDGNSNFFQCRKFRGEGDANTYYHAIDFGYKNHDQVDFHEYGGKWNFYKNQSGKVNEGVLCGSITSNGWEGRAKLKSGSTMVTSQLTENSDAIATTAFVHGLVDNVKHYSASNPPPYPVTSVNNKTGAVTLAKGDVGLGNVDNTSDANKPISTATQAALNGKQSKITANGILKGDGSGNITAASETEVELVSLPNICNPNLLDNWYFANPVNQRGQTEYPASNGVTYTIDRWV